MKLTASISVLAAVLPAIDAFGVVRSNAAHTAVFMEKGAGGMFDTRNPEPSKHEDPRKSISAAPSFEEYMKSRGGFGGFGAPAPAAPAPAAPPSWGAPAAPAPAAPPSWGAPAAPAPAAPAAPPSWGAPAAAAPAAPPSWGAPPAAAAPPPPAAAVPAPAAPAPAAPAPAAEEGSKGQPMSKAWAAKVQYDPSKDVFPTFPPDYPTWEEVWADFQAKKSSGKMHG